MAEVATAYVTLLPSAKGFGKRISGEIGPDLDRGGREGGKRFSAGMSSGIGGGVKKMFAPIAAGIAAIGVAGFFKDAIGGASDLNEAGTKTEAIFGKAGKAMVDAFASKGAKALGQSRLDVLNAAASFGTFGKAAGLAGKPLADFSTGFASLSTDLASFYNTDPAQAAEAISAGLRGEAEPLRQYGVLLDDATLRQEALKLGLIKTTKQALTPQQKVLAAQAAIYKQTKDAQGDFGRTSGGLANQQRILAATFTDLKSKLGEKLLPVALKFAKFLNDKAVPAITGFVAGMENGTGVGGRFADKAKEIGDRIKGFVDDFKNGEGAAGKFRTVLETVVGVAQNVAKWIGENSTVVGSLVSAITAGIVAFKVITGVAKAYAAVQAILNVVLTANPIGLIIVAIAALAAGLIYAYKHSDKFRLICQTAFKAIGDAARFMWNNVIAPVLRLLLNGFSAVAHHVATLLHALGNVPGFGWAETAARKLDGAAKKANELAKGIRDIPERKVVNVDIYARTRTTGRVTLPDGSHVNVGARARGGPVRAGQPYVVGEKRPELFVPKQDGTIVPRVPDAVTGARGGLSQADVLRIAGAMAQVQLQTTVSAGSFDRQMGARL